MGDSAPFLSLLLRAELAADERMDGYTFMPTCRLVRDAADEDCVPFIAFCGSTASGKSRLLSAFIPEEDYHLGWRPSTHPALSDGPETADVSVFRGIKLGTTAAFSGGSYLLDCEGTNAVRPGRALRDISRYEGTGPDTDEPYAHVPNAAGRRAKLVDTLLPTLVYNIADVIVYVTARSVQDDRRTLDELYQLAKRSVGAGSSPWKPALVVIENRCDPQRVLSLKETTIKFIEALTQYDNGRAAVDRDAPRWSDYFESVTAARMPMIETSRVPLDGQFPTNDTGDAYSAFLVRQALDRAVNRVAANAARLRLGTSAKFEVVRQLCQTCYISSFREVNVNALACPRPSAQAGPGQRAQAPLTTAEFVFHALWSSVPTQSKSAVTFATVQLIALRLWTAYQVLSEITTATPPALVRQRARQAVEEFFKRTQGSIPCMHVHFQGSKCSQARDGHQHSHLHKTSAGDSVKVPGDFVEDAVPSINVVGPLAAAVLPIPHLLLGVRALSGLLADSATAGQALLAGFMMAADASEIAKLWLLWALQRQLRDDDAARSPLSATLAAAASTSTDAIVAGGMTLARLRWTPHMPLISATLASVQELHDVVVERLALGYDALRIQAAFYGKGEELARLCVAQEVTAALATAHAQLAGLRSNNHHVLQQTFSFCCVCAATAAVVRVACSHVFCRDCVGVLNRAAAPCPLCGQTVQVPDASSSVPPHVPPRILSMDGGGVRGLATAIMLAHVLDAASQLARIDAQQPLEPTECFDIISGTSAGGILAIAVWSGLPARRAVELCREVGTAVFGAVVSTKLGMLDVLPYARERSNRLRTLITRHLQGCSPPVPFATVLVTATAINASGLPLHLLTNRALSLWNANQAHAPSEIGDVHPIHSMVDAALATSAAPLYLAETVIDGTVYQDGALRANNPSRVAVDTARNLRHVDTQRLPFTVPAEDAAAAANGARFLVSAARDVGCVHLSLGTGHYASSQDGKDSLAAYILQVVGHLATVEAVHDDLRLGEYRDTPEAYVRLQPGPSVGNTALNEANPDRLERMAIATRSYLDDNRAIVVAAAASIVAAMFYPMLRVLKSGPQGAQLLLWLKSRNSRVSLNDILRGGDASVSVLEVGSSLTRVYSSYPGDRIARAPNQLLRDGSPVFLLTLDSPEQFYDVRIEFGTGTAARLVRSIAGSPFRVESEARFRPPTASPSASS